MRRLARSTSVCLPTSMTLLPSNVPVSVRTATSAPLRQFAHPARLDTISTVVHAQDLLPAALTPQPPRAAKYVTPASSGTQLPRPAPMVRPTVPSPMTRTTVAHARVAIISTLTQAGPHRSRSARWDPRAVMVCMPKEHARSARKAISLPLLTLAQPLLRTARPPLILPLAQPALMDTISIRPALVLSRAARPQPLLPFVRLALMAITSRAPHAALVRHQ